MGTHLYRYLFLVFQCLLLRGLLQNTLFHFIVVQARFLHILILRTALVHGHALIPLFVFSISMPFAAWVASKYFVPFYRGTGEISAYTHLENRFGPWARTYTVICFLLTQLARMGSIFFGIALSLQALIGYPMSTIMIIMGVCIILYTVLGGMEAVIWTEVVQGVIKTLGALLILYLIVAEMSGGVREIFHIGENNQKFSLGSFSPDLT